jgi:transcriptional regulator with XRE-family HTH domain
MTSALSWAACGGRTWAQVEPPNDLSNFSSALKTLFTRYGWAASEIAQRTGAPSRSTIGRWRRGASLPRNELPVIQFGNAVGLTDDEIRGLQPALKKSGSQGAMLLWLVSPNNQECSIRQAVLCGATQARSLWQHRALLVRSRARFVDRHED